MKDKNNERIISERTQVTKGLQIPSQVLVLYVRFLRQLKGTRNKEIQKSSLSEKKGASLIHRWVRKLPLEEGSLGKDRNSRPISKHRKSNVQQTGSQHQTKWRET